MASDSVVADRLRPLGPIFRARDAVRTGLSWRDLYQARDSGLVVELSRGLYQLREMAGIDQIDFLVCALVPPKGWSASALPSPTGT
ncbi:MAG: type IV toxin-antitoxin system AbiEi family antitoxin domain-containing protein [Acidimicrobiales bacterium]